VQRDFVVHGFSWPNNEVPLSAAHKLGPVFEHSAEAMMLFDPRADRILAANAAADTLFARPLAGESITALHPGQRGALVVFSQGVLHKGQAWTHSLSPVRPDGSSLRLEYSGSVLPGADGGTLILVHAADLETRRRRSVDAQAETFIRSGMAEWQRVDQLFRDIERENQLILRAAGEGIFGVNAEGRATFLNPAAERMLGWQSGELVGQNMHAVMHHTRPDGSHYHERDCPVYAAFRDGIVHQVEEELFYRRDGSSFWVTYTSTPIRDRGALVGAVVVFRDISQRREGEERLRAALEEVQSLRQRLELENAYLQEEIRTETRHHRIIGRSAAVQQLLRQVDLVAPTDATVLITGESGTGKELVAHAIHDASQRSARPLIRVNCAAIPRELFESEFFGHVRGAFTGALRDRVGRFELAHGGTLFLDEVGEIPLELQGKLLRVLQEGSFERVGEERTRTVDVRVIAATNRDLKQEVRRGRFREDLYFRLNVFPVESVPLRERRDDIPLLAAHFLEAAGRKLRVDGTRLTEGNVRQLAAYGWPGNVRELENVIERAVILARDGRLRFDLPDSGARLAMPQQAAAPAGRILTEDDRRVRDRQNIEAALKASGGRVYGAGGAAELLGLRPTTLASRIKALGIAAPA
jgi:PAS domain S-box-containing protein